MGKNWSNFPKYLDERGRDAAGLDRDTGFRSGNVEGDGD